MDYGRPYGLFAPQGLTVRCARNAPDAFAQIHIDSLRYTFTYTRSIESKSALYLEKRLNFQQH